MYQILVERWLIKDIDFIYFILTFQLWIRWTEINTRSGIVARYQKWFILHAHILGRIWSPQTTGSRRVKLVILRINFPDQIFAATT